MLSRIGVDGAHWKCIFVYLQASDTGSSISYPSLAGGPLLPPSYDSVPTTEQQSSLGVGQLIDLGSDITAPPPTMPQEGEDDIMMQFAQLGITTTAPPPTSTAPAAMANGMQQESVQGERRESLSDEFDMFAQSRTAYGTHQG